MSQVITGTDLKGGSQVDACEAHQKF